MATTKAKKQAIKDFTALKVPAWHCVHKEPDRANSLDAYKLPSLVNGKRVYPKPRPAPAKGAEVI